MNLSYLLSTPRVTCFANDNDALIPEIWAMEALRTLASNMVMGSLVNRNFEDEVRNYGDVVNTSRPADFSGKRKTDADQVTEQDAVSPNIPVPLDQHVHVTFIIKDGEMSKALPNLVDRYLEPAARELAEKVDQIVAGQAVRLATNTAGRLGEMDKTNAADFILDANTQLDINRAPRAGRNLVLGPRAQQAALSADLVVSADKRGDEGTALREASLGRIYGLDSFMDQNVSYVSPAGTDVSAGVTTAAYTEGHATAVATDVAFADVTVGDYVTIEGDGEAYRVSAVADNTGDADITVEGGLQHDVASGAAVTVYKSADVNGNYALKYSKEVSIDGHASGKNLQIGQWVTFGTGAASHSYTVIAAEAVSATETSVLLDRPLDVAVNDGDAAFVGPAGGMNLAFHKDSVALVVRPLMLVPENSGARSFVASYDGLSMRVTMQYDSKAQGMRVTFDLLCGVAVLDERLAVVMYS